MKNSIFFLALFFVGQIAAQNNCEHNVSTNPANPTNDALPIGTADYSNNYLNGFNWFPVSNDGLLLDYLCTNIQFGSEQYIFMNNILLNSLDDYDYLISGPKPLNINGWELLLVNLGRFPDDQTIIQGSTFQNALPYIVIYNRYSGVLRIFMNFGPDHVVGNGPDAIKISIFFPDNSENVSGLLRLNDGGDVSLDNLTGVNSVASICKAPAFGHQWASTDIRIAYDPCTCYYPSYLKIGFELMSSSTIELHGRGIELTNQALVNNSTLQVNPSDYLSGFDYTGNTVNGGGIAMHKSISIMMEDYLALYEKYNHDLVLANEHNVKVKRNLAIIRAAKFIAGVIETAVSGNFAIPTPELMAELAAEQASNETLGLSQEQINEAYEGLGVTTWWEAISAIPGALTSINNAGNRIINTEEFFKTVTQIFGDKGKTFIANNFIQQQPTPPSMPTANFTEMHYTGQISNNQEIGGIKFFTPGTYGSVGTGSPVIPTVLEYPVYNEVLGSFALLESPKIEMWESQPINVNNQIDDKILYYTHTDEGGNEVNDPQILEFARNKTWEKNYEIKLKEDLKYAFNTALDIKSTNVQASFKIISKLNNLSTPPMGRYSLYNNSDFKANVSSEILDFEQNSKIIGYDHNYGDHFVNLDFNSSHYDPSNLIPSRDISDSTFEIQSPYLPIDAFFPMICRFGLKNEFESFSDQSIMDEGLLYSDAFFGNFNYPLDVNYNSQSIELPVDFNPIKGLEYNFDIELKLIVNMEFNTINQYGVNNSLTQVLTFKVDPNDIEMKTQPMSFTTYLPNITDFSLYQYDLVLNGANFNGQEVEGCQLSGNVYTCQAINNLIITDDILVSPGYFVNLFGGNLVTVENNSVVSPESLLSINKVLDYSHPMPNVSSNFLQTFCQGTSGNAPAYKANSLGKAIQQFASDTIQNNYLNNNFLNWNFNLYPNPTTTSTIVQLDNSSIVVSSIEVFDMMGKKLEVDVRTMGNNSFNLNLNKCSSGMYFVKVSSLSGTQTKQLIIE